MRDKTKNVIQTIFFIFILFLIFFLNLIKTDEKISVSERRKLASFPELTAKNIFSSKFGEKFENYAMDQMVFRDDFRSIKTNFEFNILHKKDNNGLFIINNNIYKLEYPLKETEIKKAAQKFESIKEKYLKNSKAYYAIIPDKSYYLDKSLGYIKLDHNKLVKIMNENIKNIEYIEISDCFNESSYYKTDLHIKQEAFEKAVNKISEKMNINKIDFSKFEKKKVTDFYGTYFGQIMKDIGKDEIYCLIDENTKKSTTFNYENNKTAEVYDLNKLSSNDLYDIFVSGPVPLIDINNSNQTNGKELIIFRDSFGSSIAPLFLQNYSKITLVDIRYIMTDLLDQFIEFENQDVLFLYNDLILNNSSILK